MAHEHGIFSNVLNTSRELYRALANPVNQISRVQTLEERLAELERARAFDQRELAEQRAIAERLRAEKTQWQKEKAEHEAERARWEKEKEELEGKLLALAERLNTSSRNSSQPASQDRPDQKPARTRQGRLGDGVKRKPGGQAGHAGRHRPLLDAAQVDRIVPVPCPERCECGGTLHKTGAPYRLQQAELPKIEVTITEFQLEHGACDLCGKVVRAALPQGVVPGMFGACLLGFIALLVGGYQLSRRSVSTVLEALTGLRVSPATVSKSEARVSAALATPYEQGRTAVRESEAANFDETGSRRDGKRSWIWLAASQTIAVFLVSPGRGAQALTALIGEAFKGIMTSDRWHTYNRHLTRLRQLCWAHLLRDWQKIADRGGHSRPIGEALLEKTYQMFKVWGQFKDGVLTREQLKEQMIPLKAAIEQRLHEGTLLTKAPATVKTCKNVLKLKEALWTFVEHEGIDPTNNRAERLIRKAVLWRKRSFGTWSERGDRYLERLLTVITSLRLQNRPVLPYLTEAIRAHYAGTKAPSLLPE